MPNFDTRQILFLKKGEEPKTKLVTGLRPYVGGLGLAVKLYADFGLPTLAVGPLSGSFPSSGVAIYFAGGLDYQQLGDDLAVSLSLRGLDGVVAADFTVLELPGVIADFLAGVPEKPSPFKLQDTYEILYGELYDRVKNIWFKDFGRRKACITCPLGCGEFNQSFTVVNLCSLLGTCQAVASVYNEVPVAFAALRELGYDYSHEELEEAVGLVKKLVG